MRDSLAILAAFGVAFPLFAGRLLEPGPVESRGGGQVARTLHNLSVTGPGEVRAVSETQICKFCHTPHSAVLPKPLWGHVVSDVSSYDVPAVKGPLGVERAAPQPDGTSRLCLSCHDGTVAIGAIGKAGKQIRMRSASRLTEGRRGFLGTDLSGGHPISVSIPTVSSVESGQARDMGLKPLAVIENEGIVHLDERKKMQCTTCHDPHDDSYFKPGEVPHFWVRPTVSEVCEACHLLQ